MFRIGEFASLAGVSAKTLRAWDDLGLFRPAWVDPWTAYRGYSPAQLPELRRIVALRDVGVPLAEIAGLIDGGQDLREVLRRRRAELERERAEVERRLQALEISMGTSELDGLDIVVRPIAAERVALLALDDDRDIGEAFYELEVCVRDQHRRAHRPPGALVPKVETDRTELFVPIRGPLRPCGHVRSGRLPACRAASVILHGPYEQLPRVRRSLDVWVRAAGHVPDGPLRILYLQFGAEPELGVPARFLVGRSSDLVTELQQPISGA
jgi:DNA-binding transcriptional MerR regulator